MARFNFNISSLFSGLNSNSPFSSFNLSDYASIKNGSYGKLIKSYYAEQKKTSSSDKTTTDNKKDQTVDKIGLSQMKKEADSLKNAAEALGKSDLWKQTDGKYDMDKITSAVKSFVSEYNEAITQAGKVNSKDIATDVKYMSSMTTTMSKALSKIGVTVGTDGKLSLNEDELKKANVSSIKSLFTGTVSYGSQIADKASAISKDAVMNSSIYGSNGMLSSSMSSIYNKWI